MWNVRRRSHSAPTQSKRVHVDILHMKITVSAVWNELRPYGEALQYISVYAVYQVEKVHCVLCDLSQTAQSGVGLNPAGGLSSVVIAMGIELCLLHITTYTSTCTYTCICAVSALDSCIMIDPLFSQYDNLY